jgi:two-component system chemotaxis response regulator CheB
MIVDDSAFMRKVLEDILTSNENIRVAAKARNGLEALENLRTREIDVITMDIEMPKMNGIEALETIMRENPTPVIMLSSFTNEGTVETIKSLELGAVDFIPKPSNILKMDLNQLKEELVKKVLVAATVKVSRYSSKDKNFAFRREKTVNDSSRIRNLIAVATSTGGPRALQEVLPAIPGDIEGFVMVVQHMPPGFTKSLAERLDSMCQLKVKEAEDGELAKPGYCYIAPGDYHMRVSQEGSGGNFKIVLGRDEAVSGHRPSADVMFESISRISVDRIVAVIMTGMGSDGAKGMARLKDNINCYSIAQDEETSVVFGMPKSAIKAGAVDRVVPLKDISSEILKSLEV